MSRAQAASFALAPVASRSFALTPAWNFSQMRGTANTTVGCTSRRFSGTLSRLSANEIDAPHVIGAWIENICSAMCESGRYDRLESEPFMPTIWMAVLAVHARLRCDSITAFGGPVVPEV